ncbi:MAG: hypothetical protein ABIK83_07780 [Candidatus Zixiibacteriota bacterium]
MNLLTDSPVAGFLLDPVIRPSVNVIPLSPVEKKTNIGDLCQNLAGRLNQKFGVLKTDERLTSSTTVHIDGTLELFTPRFLLSVDVDTILINIIADSIDQLRRQFEDEVFAKLGAPAERSDDTLTLLYATTNQMAYWHHIVGLGELNKYTRNGIYEALHDFREAISQDSSFAISYLYIAYCYNLLADRLWKLDPYPIMIDSSQKYLRIVSERFPQMLKHPLYSKVIGDLSLLEGDLHYGFFVENSDQPDDSVLNQSFLFVAEKHYLSARKQLIEAIQMLPSYYKLRFNLGLVNFQLYNVELQYGDSAAARSYLKLALRLQESSEKLFAVDFGIAAQRAEYLFHEFKSFERDNPELINHAIAVLDSVTHGTTSDVWKGYAHFYSAEIWLFKGDTTRSLDDLCKANQFDPFDVKAKALWDLDYKPLWKVLREKTTLEERCAERGVMSSIVDYTIQ